MASGVLEMREISPVFFFLDSEQIVSFNRVKQTCMKSPEKTRHITRLTYSLNSFKGEFTSLPINNGRTLTSA